MARNMHSVVKQSRREGYALHPKAHKALVKRTALPGAQAGSRRPAKPSQYSLQLREKQKVKRLYGLLEKQFANLMSEANKNAGQSGENLLCFLEQRADNVVYRAAFATSRRAARQLVTHGHFTVNGRRVDVPSMRLAPGDVIEVRDHSKHSEYFKKLDEVSPAGNDTPSWIKVDRKKLSITVSSLPSREHAEP